MRRSTHYKFAAFSILVFVLQSGTYSSSLSGQRNLDEEYVRTRNGESKDRQLSDLNMPLFSFLYVFNVNGVIFLSLVIVMTGYDGSEIEKKDAMMRCVQCPIFIIH